jgi:hypothetical protein
MNVLLAIHHGLQGIGRGIAPLVILALVAMLFVAPVFAMLFVSFYAGMELQRVTGTGVGFGMRLVGVPRRI